MAAKAVLHGNGWRTGRLTITGFKFNRGHVVKQRIDPLLIDTHVSNPQSRFRVDLDPRAILSASCFDEEIIWIQHPRGPENGVGRGL